MANVILESLECFSSVLVLMCRDSKSAFCKWPWILNFSKWILVVDTTQICSPYC